MEIDAAQAAGMEGVTGVGVDSGRRKRLLGTPTIVSRI